LPYLPAPRRDLIHRRPQTYLKRAPQHDDLQVSLQFRPAIYRSTKPFRSTQTVTVHMFASFRPTPDLLYEHVFCSLATSTLAQRARGALSLTRAFLLLEDDDPVDWEVGRDDRALSGQEPAWASAHRTPLRGRRLARRPGQLRPRPQPCLCPIANAPAPRSTTGTRYDEQPCPAPQRGSRITTGSSRVAIDL